MAWNGSFGVQAYAEPSRPGCAVEQTLEMPGSTPVNAT